jgi:hypothetical protein
MKQSRFSQMWINRLNRRASEHGVTLNQAMLAHNVNLLWNHSEHTPYHYHTKNGVWTDKTYSGPELTRISLRQIAKDARYSIKDVLEHIEKYERVEDTRVYDPSLGFSRLVWVYHPEEWIGYIPHTALSSGADMVDQANLQAIHESFKDLFDYGILSEFNNRIIVYLDRSHHSEDRMQELYNLIERLYNYPLVDEDLYSQMQSDSEHEYVKSELQFFVRKLDVHEDLEFLFDTDLITDDTLISHIFHLISEHNLEFEITDGAWINIEKIAKLSPLYQLGHTTDNKLDEVIAKVETTAILSPAWSTVLNQVLTDLRSIAYTNGQPTDQLAYC